MIQLFTTRHSIFTQIVLWAVFTAAEITFGLWLLTDSTVQRSNRISLERAMTLDLAGMTDIYAGSGEKGLIERIGERVGSQPRRGSRVHYLLTDKDGRRLAGDIKHRPELVVGAGQTAEVVVDGKLSFARAKKLGDLQVVVALEHSDLDILLRRIAFVFLTGGVLAVLAVALGGWMAAHRLAGRIDKINAAFRQPDETVLEELTHSARNHDEIDELASHSANALARLSHLVTSQREITDHVAHEIRTPLMHLDNRLAKALAATPDTETARRIADGRTEIRAIIRMLESLLDIASTEARRGDRQGLEPVNLSKLALHLGELYADSAEESGHHFELDIAPGVVIPGEEMQLTRLITNLLDNAFKYVPKGGTVRLQLKPGPRLTVSDNGPGIPEDQRERIFEKFSRGGSSVGRDGVGLGLALCRAIAERHHLEISLTSDQGGACFTVAPEAKL